MSADETARAPGADEIASTASPSSGRRPPNLELTGRSARVPPGLSCDPEPNPLPAFDSGVDELDHPGSDLWAETMSSGPGVARIEILHLPGCPLVDHVRQRLRRVLATTGTRLVLTERVGDYPSPTLLVDGRDVTGRPLGGSAACRLDLPTEGQILAGIFGDRR